MNDLDKKLKELDLEFLHGVPVSLTDAMVEQIKQVFADAGYIKPISLRNYHDSIR